MPLSSPLFIASIMYCFTTIIRHLMDSIVRRCGCWAQPIDIDYLPSITCRLVLQQLEELIDRIIAVPSRNTTPQTTCYNSNQQSQLKLLLVGMNSISERLNRRKGGGVIRSMHSIHSGPSSA